MVGQPNRVETVIVVPCYNEARRLDVVRFRAFAAAHSTVRFLLVNDGSRDGTLALLQRLSATNPQSFAILNLPVNGGKAEAIRQGILVATQNYPNSVGFWDADLATPLEAIPQFTRVLAERPDVEAVIGARVPLLGRCIHRRPLRRWLGRMFARGASLVLGTKFFDTQCGAKLFRNTPEFIAAVSQPFRSRWIFDVELFARLINLRRGTALPSLGETIFEYPLDRWDEVPGSKLKRGDFFKAIGELASIWWHYLRRGSPAITLPELLPSGVDAPPEHRRAA